MKLEFLGTRGEIEVSNERHRRHTATMVNYYDKRVLLDCGEDWLGLVDELQPHAIIVTHAHPDHAWGLKNGAPCPVHATEVSWELMNDYPIEERKTVPYRKPVKIKGITFKAFPIEHSTRCPAVCYRISAGRATILYAPDVAYIHDRSEAFKNVRLYVGDGASLSQSLIRKQKDNLIGHSPIRTQLTWCQKEGVKKAVFTHCGSQIVKGDERKLKAQINQWAKERGVEAHIAHDDLHLNLR